MPHGLDGSGSDNHQGNMSLEGYGGKSDLRTMLPSPEYQVNFPDHRPAPPTEYHAAPVPPISTYPYGPLVESVNHSPQWFDFPHLTRHPVPAALPVWATHGPPQSGVNPWGPPLQTSQLHNYDNPTVHHSLDTRKASIASLDSGIIMNPSPMRGPSTGVSRGDHPVPYPFEPSTSPSFGNYSQHNGGGRMHADAAHYQYGPPSEPRYACPFAAVALLMSSFVGTGGQ